MYFVSLSWNGRERDRLCYVNLIYVFVFHCLREIVSEFVHCDSEVENELYLCILV